MYGLKGDKSDLVVYPTVAILLVTTLGITNVNALEFSNLDKVDDIGQSAECVIMVVGCDGTGSVGSSGDTFVGSNNGNNNENNPQPPPTSEPTTCEECFTLNLTPEEILLIEDDSGSKLGEICLELSSLSSLPPESAAEELAELEQDLVELGVDPLRAQAVIECLEIVFGL